MLKYYIEVIIRNLLKIFWFFPIEKKQLYFQSFGGESISCNPLYIFRYLHNKYPDFMYVWALNHQPETILKNVNYVKINTVKWFKMILSSKVIITNCGFPAYIPYRRKQVLIETWHGGGAYKKVDSAAYLNKNAVYARTKALSYISNYLTYYISSSQKFSEVMSISHKTKIDKFVQIGMPRNDVFFDETLIKENKNKICAKYALNPNDLIVMYAPTYRNTPSAATFNNCLDTIMLSQKLNDMYNQNVVTLFRGHHVLKSNSITSFDYDVSDYPDMQELLCATDILITDYSSSMWDYSFLYRPCFLFAPDIDEYMAKRGFYTDPYSWGFPICKNNNELANAITNFDNTQFVAAMKKHHSNLVSYENGIATEKISEQIERCLHIG